MSEFRIRTSSEVVSQGELRRRHSNTSFPAVWNQEVFDFLGVDPIFAAPQPENTDLLKTVIRNGVTQDTNSNWIENWAVVDIFADKEVDNVVVTKATQEAEFLANRTATRWASIRQQRDNLLKECDWVTIRSTDISTPVPTDWATYRQALRDITTQTDPFDITWPTKPE